MRAMLWPAKALGEDPGHDRPALEVGVQALYAYAVAREGPVGVRAGIDKAVTVRRAAAEVAALVAGLHGHRRAGADTGAGDLSLGQDAEQDHQLLLPGGLRVDASAQLRHPHLDAVVVEERSHGRELVTVEGPFTGADDNGIEVPVGVGHRRQQRGGLGPPRPGHGAAAPGVEELGDDPSVSGHQGLRAQHLPGLRRVRVLMVLGGHPAVERKPQTVGGRHADGGGAGSPIAGPICHKGLARNRSGLLSGRSVGRCHDRRLPSAVVPCLTARMPGQSGPPCRNTKRRPERVKIGSDVEASPQEAGRHIARWSQGFAACRIARPRWLSSSRLGPRPPDASKG